MRIHSEIFRAFGVLAVAAASVAIAPAQVTQFPTTTLLAQHPAIGSWMGQAVQLCATLTDPSCFQVTLLMTPTIMADGGFVAGDTLELGGPPFGPHTTAHGAWIATSNTDIIADYVFILPNTTTPLTFSILRFRWMATAVSSNEMTGYVNAFFGAPVPVNWQNIAPSNVPTLPTALAPFLTPPLLFYKDPAMCPGGPPACPLVFKFTIQRISPNSN